MLARDRKMAVIVSSHLLSEMEMMCDRIGIIQGGKLVDVQLVKDFVGTSEKIYALEVNKKEHGLEIIREKFPQSQAVINHLHIEGTFSKEEIPAIVRMLVEADINIYSIKEISKTLEDRFLEVTGREEQ